MIRTFLFHRFRNYVHHTPVNIWSMPAVQLEKRNYFRVFVSAKNYLLRMSEDQKRQESVHNNSFCERGAEKVLTFFENSLPLLTAGLGVWAESLNVFMKRRGLTKIRRSVYIGSVKDWSLIAKISYRCRKKSYPGQ